MEGKKETSCLSSTAGSHLHGKGETGKGSSSSSGLFSSVFPRPSTMELKDSSHSDIFGPPRKQGYADLAWRTNEGNTVKGSKERATAYQGERSEACSLGDSLYYGGQDICTGPPNSQSSYGSSYTYKKDGKDDSGNGSDFASRGNWWQGSLYY